MQELQIANTSEGFFDRIFDEVSSALQNGASFAPGAIERTLAPVDPVRESS